MNMSLHVRVHVSSTIRLNISRQHIVKNTHKCCTSLSSPTQVNSDNCVTCAAMKAAMGRSETGVENGSLGNSEFENWVFRVSLLG